MRREVVSVEDIIHGAFHKIADKYDLDVDVVAQIIWDYDQMVSPQLEIKSGAIEVFGRN